MTPTERFTDTLENNLSEIEGHIEQAQSYLDDAKSSQREAERNLEDLRDAAIANDPATRQAIVILGNFVDGYTFVGPFPDTSAARAYPLTTPVIGHHVIELEPPTS